MKIKNLIIQMLAIAIISPGFAQVGDTPWAKHRKDIRNWGMTSTHTAAIPAVKWTAFCGVTSPAGPVIGTDGAIYVGCLGSIRQFFRDGSAGWVLEAGSDAGWSGITVGSDGSLYGGSRYENRAACAIRADGTTKWLRFLDSGSSASPTIGKNGNVYIQTNTSFYALNQIDGTVKWQVNGSGLSYGTPVLTTDDSGKQLIIAGYKSSGANQPDLVCIRDDGTVGTVVWRISTACHLNQPVLSFDGNTVYVACSNDYSPVVADNFFAVNAKTGAIKWSINTGGSHFSSPVLGPDGTIYVGSTYAETPYGNGQFFAIRDNGSTGQVKWVLGTDSTAESSGTPAVNLSGIIYFPCDDGTLTCARDYTTGPIIQWKFYAGSAVASPCIDQDGTVYFTTAKRILFALATPAANINPAATIKEAKSLYSDDKVSLLSKCVTTNPGGGVPDGSFYIEEPDKSSGIRVIWSAYEVPRQGDIVHVTGQMGTIDGEQVLTASSVQLVGKNDVRPMFANNKSLGSSLAEGLLFKVAGKVTQHGSDYFMINDASSITSSNPVKVMVGNGQKPGIGTFGLWEGIRSVGLNPTLLWRKPNIPEAGPGKMTYAEQKILLVLYLYTNGGTISETDAQKIIEGANKAKLFYQRHSHSRYNQLITQLIIRTYRDIVSDTYIHPSSVEPDLHANGIIDGQYDGVMVVAAGCGSYGWGVNQILGTAGYCQVAFWGVDAMPWLFVHEYGHVLDSQFYHMGLDSYPGNHPGTNKENIGAAGPNWDVNIDINRNWDHWLELATNPNSHWGHISTATDADGDGMPDSDSRFMMDEARLGSSAALKDTDGDGLDDLGEFMSGAFESSSPTSVDSDGDGLIDGVDKYPIYPIHSTMPYRALTINSPLTERTYLGSYLNSNKSKPVAIYANWDNNYLHLALRVPWNCNYIDLNTDNNNDGLFHGMDNYSLRVDVNGSRVISQILQDAFNVPYPHDYREAPLSEPFLTRVETGTNLRTIYLAIPKNKLYGLDLQSGEEIGLRPIVEWYEVFEPDVYMRFKLQ